MESIIYKRVLEIIYEGTNAVERYVNVLNYIAIRITGQDELSTN